MILLSHFSFERGYYGRKNIQRMHKAHSPERLFVPMKPDQADADSRASRNPALLPSVFDDLFREHWQHVYRLLLGLVGDPAEAEDLALETFLRLYRRPPGGAQGFNFGGWLHRVAANLGLHSIRSYKRRERYELSAGKFALEQAAPENPAEQLAQAEARNAARHVLAGMPEKQSRLLILRYSGLSYKEIGAALTISPASVGPLLLRAEREFEKRHRALFQEKEE
jgi:RNA polymerase sigma factor (sigma-70 family)